MVLDLLCNNVVGEAPDVYVARPFNTVAAAKGIWKCS